MRIGVVVLTVLLLPAAVLAHGAHEPDTLEVTGEVVDLACFLSYGARGTENALCASNHIAPDQPLALLGSDASVLLLWAGLRSSHPFDLARQCLGETVKVVGVPYERDGVKGLEVRELTRMKTRRQNSP